MSVKHRALAALVAAIWGVNFLAIHASLEAFPPFLLAALRWTTLAVPALLYYVAARRSLARVPATLILPAATAAETTGADTAAVDTAAVDTANQRPIVGAAEESHG